MSINDGIGNPVKDPFPGVALPSGTGAPGSPSPDTAAATAGPVVGSPVVSNPYASSQLADNRPRLTVTSGDTSGFSDDNPVHTSPIMPGPVGDYASAGPFPNRTDHWTRYPWQEGRS